MFDPGPRLPALLGRGKVLTVGGGPKSRRDMGQLGWEYHLIPAVAKGATDGRRAKPKSARIRRQQ
jgi:hypothetical protein